MKVTSLIFFFLIFMGCSADSPLGILINPPECEIISKSDIIFEKSKIPYMTITVKNTSGGPTATGINCYVRLKSNGLITNESSAYFGYLENGESKKEELWFFKLEDSSENFYKEIFLSWYDVEGTYYEKKY